VVPASTLGARVQIVENTIDMCVTKAIFAELMEATDRVRLRRLGILPNVRLAI